MLQSLLDNILRSIPPAEWKINGFALGDDFSLITNESPLYGNNKYIKRYKNTLYYREKENQKIAGITFGVLTPEERKKVMRNIKKSFGGPYSFHYPNEDIAWLEANDY